MAKLAEVKDGWSGSALLADRTGDTTTSRQSGSTFCYEKDEEVFEIPEMWGRYERWEDLYPEVMLRICGVAAGSGEGVGSFLYIESPIIGDEFYRVQIPVASGGLPVVEDPTDLPTDDYDINNIIVAVYDFEISTPNVTGYIRSLAPTVTLADLFLDADGNSMSFDSYTFTYKPFFLGGAGLHYVVSSVDPLSDIKFLDLNPDSAPRDGYMWPQQQLTELRISGTGDHHPYLGRDFPLEYAGHSVPVLSLLGAFFGQRAASSAARTGTNAFSRFAFRLLETRAGPYVGGALGGGLHIGANYILASAGYLIANVEVLPEGGQTPALI